jgi:hypothetical protein
MVPHGSGLMSYSLFFFSAIILGFLGRLMWVMSAESVLWSVWISQEVIDIRYRSGVDGKNTMKIIWYVAA